MSLVNYYSSSDDENSGDDDKTEDYVDAEGMSPSPDSSNSSKQQASKSSLFFSLPAPKSSQINTPEEVERTQSSNVLQGSSSQAHGRLGSLNLPLPKKRAKQPIKITAPSLPQANSDDEDDEPTTKKQKPATTKYSLIHQGTLNAPPQYATVVANHLATAELMNPRNKHTLASPPGLDYSLLDHKQPGKETKEHTMEELVEFSRCAMEKLHKKLELQRKQLSLLSEGSMMGQGSGASFPVREAPANAAGLQGVMHAVPPGWHLQANPLINTALHPGLSSFIQTPNFEPRTGMLTPQTFPFALPLGASGGGNLVNNLPTSISSFPGVNLASVGPQVAVARSQVNAAAEAPIPKSQSPPKQTAHSSSEEPNEDAHSNCCAACLKRISVLESKVKRILEHLINKELKQGQPSPSSSSSPFPVSLTCSSQESLQGSTPDIQSPSRFPSHTLAQFSQEIPSPFLEMPQEHSSPPTLPKPRVVYPRLLSESPTLRTSTQPTESDKYDYQSLMRYKGGSKVRAEIEQLVTHNLKNSTDSSHQATAAHSGEDSELYDQAQLQAVIYSAAVFESLPPKIQNVLNVLEKNENGSVTRLEVKQDILTSLSPYVKDRGSIARRLADVLFTDDERCFCNCSGWRKPAALDPIRMQALTDAVFKLCPAADDQKKNLWHDCVKSIDAASRHIVRIRKNKGKMPRQGKWLPFGTKGRQDRLNIVAPMVEMDPTPDTIDYGNLPARLKSILNVTHRDPCGKPIKVQLKESYLAQFSYLAKSRLTVACQLADTLFTQKERKGSSCFGGQGKRLLDPVRLEALREATFKICPASDTEQKHIWSICMKAIDRLTAIPEMIESISVSPECVSDSDDTLIKTEQCLEEGNSFYGHQFMSSD